MAGRILSYPVLPENIKCRVCGEWFETFPVKGKFEYLCPFCVLDKYRKDRDSTSSN